MNINTEKEAEEYYHHNPKDKNELHFIMVNSETLNEITMEGIEVCILHSENNPNN